MNLPLDALTQQHIFHFYGLSFHIKTENAETLKRIEKTFFFKDALKTSTKKIRGEFHTQPNDDLKNKAHKIISEGHHLIRYVYLDIYRLNEFSLYQGKGSVLILDRRKQKFFGYISKETLECDTFFEKTFFAFLFWEILSLHHLFILHAAALQHPNGESLLFIGNSRHGKSTLSLALARDGYSFLSDDMVFLSKNTLLPYTNHFHLNPQLSHFFGELKFLKHTKPQLPLDSRRTLTRTQMKKLYGNLELEKISRVDHIFFPSIHPILSSRLEFVNKSKALVQSIPSCPLIMFCEEKTTEHLQDLKRIIENANCYNFYLGKDFYHHPEIIAPFIQKQLDLTASNKEKKHVSIHGF